MKFRQIVCIKDIKNGKISKKYIQTTLFDYTLSEIRAQNAVLIGIFQNKFQFFITVVYGKKFSFIAQLFQYEFQIHGSEVKPQQWCDLFIEFKNETKRKKTFSKYSYCVSSELNGSICTKFRQIDPWQNIIVCG